MLQMLLMSRGIWAESGVYAHRPCAHVVTAVALALCADAPTAMSGTSSPGWPRWHWKRPQRERRACRI